jgi:hypothetical protein
MHTLTHSPRLTDYEENILEVLLDLWHDETEDENQEDIADEN